MMYIILVFITTGLAKATRRHQESASLGASGNGVQVENGRVRKFFDFLLQAVVAVLITVVTILDTGNLKGILFAKSNICECLLQSLCRENLPGRPQAQDQSTRITLEGAESTERVLNNNSFV